jgi:hypothetical protein
MADLHTVFSHPIAAAIAGGRDLPSTLYLPTAAMNRSVSDAINVEALSAPGIAT